MALPTTPPISLLQVYEEFGAPPGTPLSAFVRGGEFVPNTAQNAAVPTSLPIDLLDLLGAAATEALVVSASPNPTETTVFLPHAGSPAGLEVSTSTTVGVTGGSGSASFEWSYLSGAGHSISLSGSPVGKVATFSAVQPRNTELTSVWRCTVTSGADTGYVDVTVTTAYATDI